MPAEVANDGQAEWQTPTGNPRRLTGTAIDSCPDYWSDYFTDEALRYICQCGQATHRLHTHDPFTTNDHIHVHEACTTTTLRSYEPSQGTTSTTLQPTTITTTSTVRTTTPYCEACDKIVAPPSRRLLAESIGEAPATTTTVTSATVFRGSAAAVSEARTTTPSMPPPSGWEEEGGGQPAPRRLQTSDEGSTSIPSPATTTAGIVTRTRTTTTWTTTDLVLEPCSICPLYHFLCPGGCANCIPPGMCRTIYHKEEVMFNPLCDRRRAVTPPDACVDFGYAELKCPSGNRVPNRAVDKKAGQFPLLKCRVCGMDHLHEDESPYMGEWLGMVSWGPNQFQGGISEKEIHSYKLYITDSMYQKLGEPLFTQEAKMWASLRMSCCDVRFYSTYVSVNFTGERTNGTYFMVAPVTISGLELNVGPASERIVDAAGSGRRSSSSTQRRAPAAPHSAWFLAAVPIALSALAAPC